MKKYYFVSGLPRAGSTLLMNILAQNPRFSVTATSAILDIMFGVRNLWDTVPTLKARADIAAKKRVLHAILEAYFADSDKPVAFDKSRGWLSQIEMLQYVLAEEPRFIVPVRAIPDVLASFERLYLQNVNSGKPGGAVQFAPNFRTVQERCDFWMRADQPAGIAYNRIVDALQRGHSAKMLFVPFERLTADPGQIMRDIYNFLGEAPFAHNFDRVEQVTWEDDLVYMFPGLHNIRSKVEPMPSQAASLLGPLAAKYQKMDFWSR